MKEVAELGTWSPCDRRKSKEVHWKQQGEISDISSNCQGATARMQDSIRKANSLGEIHKPKARLSLFLHEPRQHADEVLFVPLMTLT